jgi:hypothetical protein
MSSEKSIDFPVLPWYDRNKGERYALQSDKRNFSTIYHGCNLSNRGYLLQFILFCMGVRIMALFNDVSLWVGYLFMSGIVVSLVWGTFIFLGSFLIDQYLKRYDLTKEFLQWYKKKLQKENGRDKE